MAITGTASISGVKAFQNRLRKIRELPRRVANAPEVRETIVERTKDRFRTKRDPKGKRWKRLNREGVILRQNTNLNDILVDSGELRDSIGVTSRRGTATGLGFRIGVTDPTLAGVLAMHQRGGISPLTGGEVPARQILGISKQDLTVIERLLKRIGDRVVGGL